MLQPKLIHACTSYFIHMSCAGDHAALEAAHAHLLREHGVLHTAHTRLVARQAAGASGARRMTLSLQSSLAEPFPLAPWQAAGMAGAGAGMVLSLQSSLADPLDAPLLTLKAVAGQGAGRGGVFGQPDLLLAHSTLLADPAVHSTQLPPPPCCSHALRLEGMQLSPHSMHSMALSRHNTHYTLLLSRGTRVRTPCRPRSLCRLMPCLRSTWPCAGSTGLCSPCMRHCRQSMGLC